MYKKKKKKIKFLNDILNIIPRNIFIFNRKNKNEQ